MLTEDVVPLIAALSAQDTDDARQAIKYLRKAGELADKSQGEQVTVDHARETPYKSDALTQAEQTNIELFSGGGCPHGPYEYRVHRDGKQLTWEYIGPVTDE